jgi:thiol-disulfide isomerase/thioredoxin
MRRSISGRFALFVLSVVVCGGGALAAELPRYSLPVGRRLVYAMSADSKEAKGGGMSISGSWQMTVVRENADGSRRVIVRTASSFKQSAAAGEGHSAPERVNFAYADVFPDGRVMPNPSLGVQVDVAGALPPLPKDQGEMEKGWSETNEAKLQTTSFKAIAAAGEGEFAFTSVVGGVMNKIYLTTQKSTYHFDRKRGAVGAVESEMSQEYGFNSKGTGTTKLESDQTIAAAELATFARDFDAFFDASRAYQALMGGVAKDPANASEKIAAAKDVLVKARGKATTPDVTKELDRILEGHEDSAKYAAESAERFKGVLNKPAAEWSATDIDGKPVKLADFRGKVVVMDFWYRGCGWCMYAMPQVIRLSEDYKDKGVVVLGMNTDAEEKDARFVIDAMGMKYPTIRATGIPERFGVRGFPTLVIVDGKGIVQDVHVGYSPTLRADLGKTIDGLLEKKE